MVIDWPVMTMPSSLRPAPQEPGVTVCPRSVDRSPRCAASLARTAAPYVAEPPSVRDGQHAVLDGTPGEGLASLPLTTEPLSAPSWFPEVPVRAPKGSWRRSDMAGGGAHRVDRAVRAGGC